MNCNLVILESSLVLKKNKPKFSDKTILIILFFKVNLIKMILYIKLTVIKLIVKILKIFLQVKIIFIDYY
jgi:hypothetical protein